MTANAKCSGSRIVERGNNKISEKQKALTTDAIERSTLEVFLNNIKHYAMSQQALKCT